jgi:hypothetical protein
MTVLHSINVRRGSPGTASGQNDIEAAATEENCRSTTNGSSAGQGQGAPLKSYGNALLQVFSIRHQPHQVKLDLIEKALMGERREDRKMGGGGGGRL